MGSNSEEIEKDKTAEKEDDNMPKVRGHYRIIDGRRVYVRPHRRRRPTRRWRW